MRGVGAVRARRAKALHAGTATGREMPFASATLPAAPARALRVGRTEQGLSSTDLSGPHAAQAHQGSGMPHT